MSFRVGLGFDFHAFEDPAEAAKRSLILGGVHIPHARGLKGHSDADALLHAVADALLGGAGLKDIGSYFPDTEEKYRGMSSLLILEKVYRLVRGKGFSVGNVDVVVIADEPRISPFVETIKSNISRVLHLKPEEIGIKATTLESCGTIGRREGLAVQAVALLTMDEKL
ncbi:MAG: 2-C-methyl-D-erythritol 2,4-cyclodiphosphate synthase [Acidobacteriota bacterium]